VRVTVEGNVVPWLMACRLLIHRGCTTGVEAYALGVPVISYRPTVDELFDFGFYELPTSLSYSCFGFDELRQTIAKILSGGLGPLDGDEQKGKIRGFLSAQEGALACERIVDVLEEMGDNPMGISLGQRISGRLEAARREAKRFYSGFQPQSRVRLNYRGQLYRGTSLAELREKAERFIRILRQPFSIAVEQVSDQLFRINAK
jgi:hypothetical protein